MVNKNFLLAVGLLAGTIIGAGIFALPYIFSQIGILSGLFYLISFAFIYSILHSMYGKVLAVQEGNHQFFYLAHKYFSKGFANFASLAVLVELIFVMLVYLVLAPTFAELVFGGSNSFLHLILFWLFSSVFIFLGLKVLEFADFAGIISILAIILIVLFTPQAGELTVPAFQKLNLPLFFLPFGPLLFSFAGRPAMHKVIEVYRGTKAKGETAGFSLTKTAFWGTLIPAAVYLLFVLGILRLNPQVSPEALNSLFFLPQYLIVLLGILGLITLWTSYFMIGVNVKDILRLDLKKPFWLNALVVLFTPLILYFLGFKEFLTVLAFTGGLFLALEAFFIITMWRRTFPQSPWRPLSFLLYLVFVVALVYTVVDFTL